MKQHCGHDTESHDPELGCLFPDCDCQGDCGIGMADTLRRIGEFIAKSAGLGILLSVTLLIEIAIVAVACGVPFPKEVDPRYNQPSPSIRPLQTARQEPISMAEVTSIPLARMILGESEKKALLRLLDAYLQAHKGRGDTVTIGKATERDRHDLGVIRKAFTTAGLADS